jgi:hypothetical protein
MSQRRTSSDNVQIRLNTRVLMLGGGILVACMVFGLAFAVGRMLNQPATADVPAAQGSVPPGGVVPVLPSGQQAPGAQPQQQQPPQQLGGKPSDTPVPVPVARAPAGNETAIGDNPRLAIPELKATGYIYDFGEIAPTAKVEKVITLKNDGTKPLEIKEVKTS